MTPPKGCFGAFTDGSTACSLTPWLTGAGSRRLEGTNISHEDAGGMAYVGVRVEPTVRLGSGGNVLRIHVELGGEED